MQIGSRDWQDFLDKQERIAKAMESIAESIAAVPAIQDAIKALQEHGGALKGALPPK
jgi:hypothetical protein